MIDEDIIELIKPIAEATKESLIQARNYGRKEMLEQVIEWLKVNTRGGIHATMQRNHTGYGAWAEVNTDELIEDLTASMRPTTTQEDNS